MKLLKQRFTQWYNGRTGRKGTLWEERFKSVLVEGLGQGLSAMAAYIDLNPVRAGLVKDPKDYRWSGYGEAMAGKKIARLGLQRVVQALLRGDEETLSRSMELYRMHVYREGTEEGEAVGIDGQTERGALKREEVLAVIEAKGRLPLSEYVRCRVRYFCDGAVFGSCDFVNEVFEANRKRFGVKRKSGARRMRGVEDALYSLRDLKLGVFG
jgi:putative transposase